MRPSSACRGVLLLSATLGACHHRRAEPAGRPAVEGTAGPASAFGPRIRKIDAAERTVTFSVDWPVQVILVSVTPGEFAVPVAALTSDTTRAQPGVHTVKFAGDLSLAGAAESPASELNRSGYERCVRTGTQKLPAQRVVRRDTTGKEIVEPRSEARPHAEATLEQSYREASRSQTSHAGTPRYLVLIATNAPMTLTDAIRRFESMRGIPNDISASIHAVTTALYADRNGTWAAHYVPW